MQSLGPSAPRQVGAYRVLAELGRGGMGRVLLGSGPDGRLVAVKLVHEQFAADEGFRARFRREVDASRAVSGAYTAAVVDADPDAPTPWLASVFVPGPSLHDTVAAVGALPEEAVLRLAAGLAAALVQIHRAGLVHRDLKPSNVLLADDGPRVIDFGIVRAADGDRAGDLTRSGWLVGSPAFMSPEQAKGEPVTAASDVFSFASVIVAACAGDSPFTDASTLQTLNNVVLTRPDLSALPAAVRRVVAPCLAKEPADRPTPARLVKSIGEIAPASRPWPVAVHQLIAGRQADVARILGPVPNPTLQSGPVTLIETKVDTGVPPGPRSRRWPKYAAAAAAVVLAGSLTWALWPSPQASPSLSAPETTQAVPSSPAAPSSPALPLAGVITSATPVLLAKFSPDGHTLATVHTDATVQLWDVAGRRQIGQILGPFGEDDPTDLAFSADGRTLVVAERGVESAVVRQWDVASGRQVGGTLDVEAGGSTDGVMLTGDGRVAAVPSPDRETVLQLWDVASGKQVGAITGPRYTVYSTLFSPDGHTMAVSKADGLVLWDWTRQQQIGHLIDVPGGLSDYAFTSDGARLVTTNAEATAPVVRVWDTASQNQLRQPVTLAGGPGYLAALSPDGRTAATIDFRPESGDGPGTVTLRNLGDGSELARIDGVASAAFSPDGRTLATAGADQNVRLWTVPA